jgi:hypothetical protein
VLDLLLHLCCLYQTCCCLHVQEYGELQVATCEQKAKPALDSIVDKIQKVRRQRQQQTGTATTASGQEAS